MDTNMFTNIMNYKQKPIRGLIIVLILIFLIPVLLFGCAHIKYFGITGMKTGNNWFFSDDGFAYEY